MPEELATPDLLSRRFLVAMNGGDFDAMSAMFSEEAVFDRSGVGLEMLEGREAIRRFLEDWAGAYEEYEQELEELSDFGEGVTFSVARQRGRLKGSSGLLELRYAVVVILADGLAVRATSYKDIDQARADAERLAESRR